MIPKKKYILTERDLENRRRLDGRLKGRKLPANWLDDLIPNLIDEGKLPVKYWKDDAAPTTTIYEVGKFGYDRPYIKCDYEDAEKILLILRQADVQRELRSVER